MEKTKRSKIRHCLLWCNTANVDVAVFVFCVALLAHLCRHIKNRIILIVLRLEDTIFNWNNRDVATHSTHGPVNQSASVCRSTVRDKTKKVHNTRLSFPRIKCTWPIVAFEFTDFIFLSHCDFTQKWFMRGQNASECNAPCPKIYEARCQSESPIAIDHRIISSFFAFASSHWKLKRYLHLFEYLFLNFRSSWRSFYNFVFILIWFIHIHIA